MRIIIFLAGLAALAGCAYTGPFHVPPPNGHAARVPTEHARNRVQTYVYAQVVTTLDGAPVQGAACGLTSAEIDLGFQTPAQIDLPVYHRPPPPARLTCRHGDRQGSILLHPRRVAEIPGEPGPRSLDVFVSLMTNAVAATLDLWTYVRKGDRIVIELGGA
ncbi:50S ribosomal protein L13 [Pseudooceanicola batsensis HTCC2597]|uniref:50S ribosomal protein L13 n=1 Tax=Pseudooceanicola batsensis (strain ATCC BAA-863 / DSM 15984 / KCTC 12145 / HTCC2597) TaxID=252305 RepID=A3TWX0_PSEBH|nr:hypothetical protein [Pseudooceanicola batsensis]EAQ03330.1 50S ribosomal protein L13 [Pseudooceanicola batsensis HTCC2597]